jgi:hypothetical protein
VARGVRELKEDSLPDSDHNLVILLKIFISFIQVIAMLGEFEVNLPSFVAFYCTIVQAGSGSAGVNVSPITCLLPQWTFLDRLELRTPSLSQSRRRLPPATH